MPLGLETFIGMQLLTAPCETPFPHFPNYTFLPTLSFFQIPGTVLFNNTVLLGDHLICSFYKEFTGVLGV